VSDGAAIRRINGTDARRRIMTIHPNAISQGNDGDAEPLVLSVSEAAALLGISKDLAYDLVRTGEIPSLKFGRRLVVPKRRLLARIDGDRDQRTQ
jgi:excisionase family DNA binding protein